jgi:tetratricopeptide (TPR) repeat protein
MNFPGLKLPSPDAPATTPPPTEQAPKTKVFVSYSRKDMAFVDRLAAGLEANGIALLIDRTEIYAFEDWWKRIENLINEADTIIFVLSPEAIGSEVCKKEVDYALSLHKRFAPIVCQPITAEMKSIPASLADLNFIFFDDPEKFDASLAKLVEALSTDISWIRQHTQFGLDAHAWEVAGKSNGLLLRSPRLEEAEQWIATRPPGAPLPSDLTQTFIRESRRGATRRRNLLTGGLGAGLILAIVLASLAFWQRGIAVEQEGIAKQATQQAETERDAAQAAEKEATAQRNRAEKVLTAATDTARSLVVDLAVKFREVKGIPLDVVQGILNKSKGLLDQLESFKEDSPSVLLNRVVTLSELGFTLAQQQDAQGGQLVSQAFDTADKLRREQPGLVGIDYAYGRAAEVLGQLDERTNPQKALSLYQDAVAAFAKSFAENPKDLDSLLHEVWTTGRIGNVYFDNRQYNDAFTIYQTSLALAQKYQGAVPSGAETDLLLAQRYNHLGRAKWELNDADNALQYFQTAVSLIEPWSTRPNPSTTLLLELAGAYNNVANVLAAQATAKKDRALVNQALGYAVQAANTMGGLASADPGNLWYWTNLAADYYNLVVLSQAIGDRNNAAIYQQRFQFASERAKGSGSATQSNAPPQ